MRWWSLFSEASAKDANSTCLELGRSSSCMPIKRGSIDLVVCTLYRIILIYWQWQCHNYIISSKNELNWKELNPSLITNSIPHKIYSQVSLIFPKSWLDFPQQWRHKTSVEGEPFRWHEIYMRSLEGMELRSFGGTLGLQGALATEIVKRYMWYNIISSLYIYIHGVYYVVSLSH